MAGVERGKLRAARVVVLGPGNAEEEFSTPTDVVTREELGAPN